MSRSLCVAEVAGERLVGTHHAPQSPGGPAPPHAALVLNFGQMPRAGAGDLAVRLADGLAQRGIAVWRYDLPGLGDSTGDLPPRQEALFAELQRGAHAPAVRALVDAIRAESACRTFTLIGMCATAWTVMASAEADRNGAIDRIVLLDPELVTVAEDERANDRGASRGEVGQQVRRTAKRAGSAAAWLRFAARVASLDRAGGLASFSRRLLRRRDGLPPGTHRPLVELLARLRGRNLPIFVVTARGTWREWYVLAVLERLRAGGRNDAIMHLSLAHTNHAFTAGCVQPRIIAELGTWLHTPVGASRGEP